MGPPEDRPSTEPRCVRGYMSWFESVTRRHIIRPTHWVTEEAFQGTQGHLPLAAENIAHAYHTMRGAGPVAQHPAFAVPSTQLFSEPLKQCMTLWMFPGFQPFR